MESYVTKMLHCFLKDTYISYIKKYLQKDVRRKVKGFFKGSKNNRLCALF
jgi:hypothetical protein